MTALLNQTARLNILICETKWFYLGTKTTLKKIKVQNCLFSGTYVIPRSPLIAPFPPAMTQEIEYFMGFYQIIWDSMGFYGILWDFMEFYRIVLDFIGIYEILWILWDLMGFYKIVWILWDFMGFYGILWDFMGFYGTFLLFLKL